MSHIAMLAARPQPNLFEPAPAVSTRGLPITLVISGDTPSKKNSKKLIPIKDKKTGKVRTLIIPGEHYEKWQKAALREISWQDGPLPDGCSVQITIFPSTRRRGDLSNKAESCLDLLVDAGVISDDTWFVVPSVQLTFGGVDKLRPRAEVTICAVG